MLRDVQQLAPHNAKRRSNYTAHRAKNNRVRGARVFPDEEETERLKVIITGVPRLPGWLEESSPMSGWGMIPFFVYNLAFDLVIPAINVVAHIGGALGGAAAASAR